jgi:hypothetical protein
MGGMQGRCPHSTISLVLRVNPGYPMAMEPLRDQQIAPAILRAIMAQAAARGLSVNDYLAQLLGIKNGTDEALALAGEHEEPTPNSALLDALQRIGVRQANRPYTKSSDTVAMIREARSGGMWGYDSTE